MPMYDIKCEEQGVRYTTYRVFAENEEEALDRVYEEDLQPDTERFKQHDGNTRIKQLPDCRCGICVAHGYAWACMDSDPEDDVLDLGSLERAWE